MKEIIKQSFNLLYEKRIEEVAFSKLKQTAAYDKTEKRIELAFKSLKESFGTDDEQHLKLLELEDAWNSQKALYLEYAYRQGLEDALDIQKELKDYGITVSKN